MITEKNIAKPMVIRMHRIIPAVYNNDLSPVEFEKRHFLKTGSV
jgi:hypothetical protein